VKATPFGTQGRAWSRTGQRATAPAGACPCPGPGRTREAGSPAGGCPGPAGLMAARAWPAPSRGSWIYGERPLQPTTAAQLSSGKAHDKGRNT